jgi:hypothetical protein
MKRDFTLSKYRELLESFLAHGYHVMSYENYIKHGASEKTLIMRHDVDKLPQQSLEKAKIENSLGIKATYYFRIVPESNDSEVISRIASLGHEIGYHYEDLTLTKGKIEQAIIQFEQHLEYFRLFFPVSTICMHGSPTSKWDNRNIWKSVDYKTYGIIGEPYFDLDFTQVLYITDTGRSWSGGKSSVRDKVYSDLQNSFSFKSTDDIMNHLKLEMLPNQIMINTHPQRWHDNLLPWCTEYISQNFKNIIKRMLFVKGTVTSE